MTTFHKIVLEFNSLVTQHKLVESLDFYDQDIVSTENMDQPVIGINALAWTLRRAGERYAG